MSTVRRLKPREADHRRLPGRKGEKKKRREEEEELEEECCVMINAWAQAAGDWTR